MGMLGQELLFFFFFFLEDASQLPTLGVLTLCKKMFILA